MTELRCPLLLKAVEAAVFAPIGAAARLRDDLPRIVRERQVALGNRVKVARWIGEQAVTLGRRELLRQLQEQRQAGAVVPAHEVRAVADPAATPEPVRASVVVIELDDAVPAATAQPPLDPPFDGYDMMPSAHVVQRLNRLSSDELAAVRSYELANRGRRTVVAKADQLLSQ